MLGAIGRWVEDLLRSIGTGDTRSAPRDDLAEAEIGALSSVLLEVQRDCIRWRNKCVAAERAEKKWRGRAAEAHAMRRAAALARMEDRDEFHRVASSFGFRDGEGLKNALKRKDQQRAEIARNQARIAKLDAEVARLRGMIEQAPAAAAVRG